MKIPSRIILLILLFPVLLSAQKKSWPYLNYEYAKAYIYNLQGELHGEYHIIKNSRIDATATSYAVKLSNTQLERFVNLTNKNIKGLLVGLSKSFIPSHAVVFFNKQHKPIASIMLCFYCESIRLWPQKKGKTLARELTEKEIKEQLIILENFEKGIKELGFPVLSSPFEYKEYANQVQKLKLHGPIKQLKSNDTIRFDLSGMCSYNNDFLAIADKNWDHFIYKLDTAATTFTVKAFQKLCHGSKKLDIEGIDFCNNRFYLANEFQNQVLIVDSASCKTRTQQILWEKIGVEHSNWANKGLEGIAIDCENKVLYLAKEREPRRIFKTDLKTLEITEPFKKHLEGGHDISDLKFKNGSLYYLERADGLITKINLETNQKHSVSFQHIVYKDEKRLYKNKNTEYGMAEAFLLTKDQIWIGIDNNGDEVSEYGKSLGMENGDNAAILIFKRPLGF